MVPTRFLIISLFLLSILHFSWAQENKTSNGKRVGAWTIQDQNDRIVAQGSYDNGKKTGEWSYFFSATSRYTQIPDMKGSYDDNGKKTGTWFFEDGRSGVKLEVSFKEGTMEGKARFLDKKGLVTANGLMNDDLRHGKWVFYLDKKKIVEGYYQEDQRIADWNYDYFPQDDIHVKTAYTYENGQKSGKIEHYVVDDHPYFGKEEFLSGIGYYSNGKKKGRWIEFSSNIQGQRIETGRYDANGKKVGFWKTTVNRRNYQSCMFSNDARNGTFREYHPNGKLKYQTQYKNGIETGAFKRYYASGQLQEEGEIIQTTDPQNPLIDTLYKQVQVPMRTAFSITEKLNKIQPVHIVWISDPEMSMEANEISAQLLVLTKIGAQNNRQVDDIIINTNRPMRVGPFTSYHENGQIHLQGNHIPSIVESFDPNTNTLTKDFARDGEWKEFDDSGFLRYKFIYINGKLVELYDDKGNSLPVN